HRSFLIPVPSAEEVADLERCRYKSLRNVNSLLRVERQGFREHLRVKDRRASSAVAVARHNIEIVPAGSDGHARGLQVVPVIPARQQYLSDWDTVLVERQHPALAI